MPSTPLRGVLPIAPTPFDEHDEVDYDGQKRIVDFLVDAGVDGICILANYSEQNTPANPGVPATGGQKQMTAQELNIGGGVSRYGRITTPYPLWDGTDRVLIG